MLRMVNTNYSTQVIHGEYYPHIDGIRALAVLPVMLFHILAALCPGGFAGVDVFFVISGYLITGGILRDLENDRFTIRNFYYRRIRRIMPAYFMLIAGVLAAGCTLYYATPLILLGDAVVAGTLFLANFHFWLQGGDYFAPDLHSQALLHLWSLSVEEQFYLFIPLLCAIIWKVRRRLVSPVLALLAVLSLSGAIYAVMTGKQNNAFYLLHFRAWELLAGSLLATLPAVSKTTGASTLLPNSPLPTTIQPATGNRTRQAPAALRAWHAFLATVGLLLVSASYAFLSSTTPFPGAAALPPVIGTVLLIRYGQDGLVSRLLSCRPFVLTGKISYSLYLWHWPIIVFWRYVVYDQPSSLDYIGMFLLSLLLGYLSWRLIELPVRTSPAWTMRRSFVFAAAGIAFLVSLGTACVYYKGWPTILHPEANEAAYMPPPRDPFLFARTLSVMRHIGSASGHDFKAVVEHEQNLQQQLSTFFANGYEGSSNIGASGEPKILLLGDSHAGSLRYGIDALLREKGIAGYAIICLDNDMFDLTLPKSDAALRKLSELQSVSHVILAEMWAREYFRKRGKAQDYGVMFARLEEFALHLRSMGKTLAISTDIPYYRYVLTDIEARRRIFMPRSTEIILDSQQQSDVDYDREQGKINITLVEICKKTGAVLIPLHLAFKQDDHYVCFEARGTGTMPLYRDADHLSMAGSLRAARFIMPYLHPETTARNQSSWHSER
ncbi:MAG: acyltransferase family protein [Thermoguttaceae bacterium]